MDSHESKFIIGGGMALAAAVVFAGVLYWHDTRTTVATNTNTISSSSPQVPPGTAQLPPGTPNPASSLSRYNKSDTLTPTIGTVTSLSSKVLVLQTEAPGINGVLDKKTFTITIDSKTELYKQGALKSDAEYQKEMDSFISALSHNTDSTITFIAPDKYMHTPLTIADFKPATMVTVRVLNLGQSSAYALSLGVIPPMVSQ